MHLGNDRDKPSRKTSLTRPLPDSVGAALELAKELTPLSGSLGGGGTRALWETLATLAAHDLGVARAVEPHLDAAAILAQSGTEAPDGAWGVFAAEGGRDQLRALRDSEGWALKGTKPWCSLAGCLDYALVTARTEQGEQRLFAVDLSQPGVEVAQGMWHARGLAEIPSGPVAFLSVPARPIGEPGWYLTRPGFWWGGIGVAACWYGGAIGIARAIQEHARQNPNPHLLAHLGGIDTLLHASSVVLANAAERVDAHHTDDGRLLAKRVRALVARTCEEVLTRAGHALGPSPLALDAAYAKQVADLQLYIRQHHAERDDASQGGILADREDAPW